MELQHRLVVKDLNKKVLKKIEIEKRIVKRMQKLNENQTRVHVICEKLLWMAF